MECPPFKKKTIPPDIKFIDGDSVSNCSKMTIRTRRKFPQSPDQECIKSIKSIQSIKSASRHHVQSPFVPIVLSTMKCLTLIHLLTIVTFVSSQSMYQQPSLNPRVITIGAVFDDSDPFLEMAFREAVDQVSLSRSANIRDNSGSQHFGNRDNSNNFGNRDNMNNFGNREDSSNFGGNQNFGNREDSSNFGSFGNSKNSGNMNSFGGSSGRATRIEAYVVNVKPGDSFHAGKIVCNMVSRGVWAIFGPSTPSVSWLVRSIANNLHIPHIQFNWDYQRSSSLASTARTSSWAPRALNMTMNLYPEASALSRAFMDYIHHRGWKSFTLVYDTNDGLIKLKDLLRLPAVRAQSFGNTDELTRMSVRQFQSNSTYKKLFKDMSKKFETNVVLNVALDSVRDILRQAKSVGMMSEYHNYLIADLDMHTLDLSEFKETNCNISGLSLVDFTGSKFTNGPLSSVNPSTLSSWPPGGGSSSYASYGDGQYRGGQVSFNTASLRRQQFRTTAPSLLFDAVSLFVRAVDDLDRTQVVYGPSLTCEQRSAPWAFGSILINFMKMMNVNGLTGNIKFDAHGQRSDFTLDVLEYKKTGFRKSGTWDPRNKVNITRNFTSDDADVKEALRNKTLRCSIPTNAEPYAMWKPDYMNLTGNERIEGYCVDLLDELAKVLGFKIELVPAPNNAYGSFKNGEWNGMIRELLDRKVDIAIADLTITSARQSAVDFTLPFMNLGISILYKKPEETPPDLFSFLKPFSVEVWIYMATAFLGVSLLLYVISRLSPYEWVSGHPCDDDPDELENQFSLGNCLWFSLGSIMQQGSDLAPRALSTRTLASIWWFFTLIMISSYTANLAAFLTVSRMASPIENAEDLAKQTTIQYGCKFEGSTYNFFKTSNHTTYERMWSTMESIRPSVFLTSNAQGIDRVKKGNYAYLMESTSIEYEVQRNCDLQQIGGMLDQKGYGIATPPDSPYRGLLSEAILQLQESGKLQELKTRWWVERIINQGITCPPDKKDSSMELDIGNVGGVFVVLIAGTAVGVFIVIIEFVWKTKKVARHERDHAAVMMWRELVRICSGGGGHRTTGSSSGSSTNSGPSSSSTSESGRDGNGESTKNGSTKNGSTKNGSTKNGSTKNGSIKADVSENNGVKKRKKSEDSRRKSESERKKSDSDRRKSDLLEKVKIGDDFDTTDIVTRSTVSSLGFVPTRQDSLGQNSAIRKVSLRSIGVAPSFDGDSTSDRPYFMSSFVFDPSNLPPPILFDTSRPQFPDGKNRRISAGEHRF